MVVLVLVLAGALTGIAYRGARTVALARAHAAFRERAAERTGALRLELVRAVESVEALADIAQVDSERAFQNFPQLSRRLLDRLPGLFSVGLAEWVPAERRYEIVEAIRRDGVALEDLFGRDSSGVRHRAPEAEHHLVLRWIHPVELAPEAVGYDILSGEDRRSVVQSAIDSGSPAATDPLRLGGDSSGLDGIIVFVPVYRGPDAPADPAARRAALFGTVSIGFQIAPLLDFWLDQHPAPLVNTTVFDRDSETGANGTLLRQGSGAAPPVLDSAELAATQPLAVMHSLEFAGQQWSAVHAPSPAFDELWRGAEAPKLILGFGTTISLLLAAIAALHLRGLALARRLADQRAAAAAELARKNEGLRRLNEDMEHFLSAIAHDLRSPLMIIRSAAVAAREAAESGEADHLPRPLERMERSTLEMERVIDGLMEHARAGYAAFIGGQVDLDELARSLVADHRRLAESVGARVEVVGWLPVIHGDRSRLATALRNLLVNALRYGHPTPHGEPLQVEIGSGAPPAEDANGFDPATHVAIYVRDNGPGVPPDRREHVFEPFVRLAESPYGTGFGLATVRRAAAAHGGRAWVDPSPTDGGATFWMTLARESVTQASAEDGEPATRHRR